MNAQNIAKHLETLGINPSTIYLDELDNALTQIEAENYYGYEPHPKQLAFHNAKAKQRLFLAGNRTGKTFCACVEVVMHLTGIYPDWWKGHRFNHPIHVWAASNTGETTRNVLQQGYYLRNRGTNGYIPPHLITRKTARIGLADAVDTVFVKHITGGESSLQFKSYDQGRAKFQGTQKHIVHFDEEPPHAVYAEALMRTMSTANHFGIMMLTMTPLLGMSDMVISFMDDQPIEEVKNDKFYLQASWADNPYLNAEEKQTLIKSFKPHEIEAREKGIPSLGVGLVYPVSESAIVCDPFEIPDYWPRLYGMDFGWTAPTAVSFAAHDRDNDILYLIGEYKHAERTPEQHATYLLTRGCGNMIGVCDPAGGQSNQRDGKDLIKVYYECGLTTLSKANNSKEAGIQKTLQRMQNGNLKIFKTCEKTLHEMRMYARDDNGQAKKGNDHLMDAMRYLVMSGIAAVNAPPQTHSTVISPYAV